MNAIANDVEAYVRTLVSEAFGGQSEDEGRGEATSDDSGTHAPHVDREQSD